MVKDGSWLRWLVMGSACQNRVYGNQIQTVKEENKFMYWQPEFGIMERSLLLKNVTVRIFASDSMLE